MQRALELFGKEDVCVVTNDSQYKSSLGGPSIAHLHKKIETFYLRGPEYWDWAIAQVREGTEDPDILPYIERCERLDKFRDEDGKFIRYFVSHAPVSVVPTAMTKCPYVPVRILLGQADFLEDWRWVQTPVIRRNMSGRTGDLEEAVKTLSRQLRVDHATDAMGGPVVCWVDTPDEFRSRATARAIEITMLANFRTRTEIKWTEQEKERCSHLEHGISLRASQEDHSANATLQVMKYVDYLWGPPEVEAE